MNSNVAGATGFEMVGFESLNQRWSRLLAIGIALSVLGVIAISVSVASTVVTVLFIAALLLAGGIVQIIHAFSTKGWSGTLLNLCLGILYVVAGVTMMARPVAGAVSLTLFLSIFFLASGAIRAISALMSRFPSWGWSVFSGLVTFCLGLLILRGMPQASLWVIGTFVGIDMIFAGASLSSVALAARKASDVARSWRRTATPSPV